MKALIPTIVEFVKRDWQESPLRCSLEIIAWFMSIGAAVLMGVTLPNPPWLILYPLFIVQCSIFAWASRTRGSTGLLANYMILVTIDTIALGKYLTTL